MNDSTNHGDKPEKFLPEIRRGRFDRLTIYEVSETELEILEKGSPSSLYLNFSIFLLSMGVAFLIALLTTDISSVKVFSFFVIITVIGFTLGVLLLILWLRTRKSVSATVCSVKKRLPPEGVQEK
jgi:hypothetical protein